MLLLAALNLQTVVAQLLLYLLLLYLLLLYLFGPGLLHHRFNSDILQVHGMQILLHLYHVIRPCQCITQGIAFRFQLLADVYTI
jgi:hypothetical protein